MSAGPSAGLRTIEYYFSLVSPWAYIGHAALAEICNRHHARIRYHPVNLSTVFPQSGGLPLLQRHPSRQRYRMLELQRWRDKRGLPFHLRPRFWPFDAALADHVAVALTLAQADIELAPASLLLLEATLAQADLELFLPAAYKAVWEEEQDLGDPAVLTALLQQGGFDAVEMLAAARSDATASHYAWNAERALDAGVFGSPSYVLEGEVFWGQDRLGLLDDALESAREPFIG